MVIELRDCSLTTDNIVVCNGVQLDASEFVEIRILDTTNIVSVAWLALVLQYRVRLPESLQHRLLDINFEPIHPKSKLRCEQMMVFKKPILYKEGYRLVPYFTSYAVSNTGEVYSVITGQKVKCYTRGGYLVADVYDPLKNLVRQVAIHRLVALAWVKNPSWMENYIVNHIDGYKLNNYYRNLEWTDYSGNAVHALENDLRFDNIPCRVRDVKTGKVYEFKTMNKAKRFMGIERYSLFKSILYTRPNKLYNKRFELRLDGDQSPWYYEGRDVICEAARREYTFKFQDGHVETFYYMNDIKKRFKVWNVGNVDKFREKFEKLYPDVEFTYIDHDEGKFKSIQAYNYTTGEVVEADSMRDMSRKLGSAFSVVRNNVGKFQTNVTGYVFRHKSDEPWPAVKEMKSEAKTIVLTNLETKEVKTLSSLREAARFLDCDRSAIKSRLVNGGEWKGWYVEPIQ